MNQDNIETDTKRIIAGTLSCSLDADGVCD